MNEIEEHDSTWNDRLQDLLDGDVDASERATIESHLGTCARCRTHFAQFKQLDVALSARLATPGLAPSFDHQVLSRIDALAAQARDQARRQADRELQQNLQALARGWRRALAFIFGGAAAGIAVAFAFTAWADTADIAERLVGVTGTIGFLPTATLHTLVTAVIGAGIGGGISRWLAATLD